MTDAPQSCQKDQALSRQIKLPLLGTHAPRPTVGSSPPNLNSITFVLLLFGSCLIAWSSLLGVFSISARDLSIEADGLQSQATRMLATGGACSGEIWISLPIWGLQFPSKYRRNSTAKACTKCLPPAARHQAPFHATR